MAPLVNGSHKLQTLINVIKIWSKSELKLLKYTRFIFKFISENSIYGGIYKFLNDKALILLTYDLLKNQENKHICQILENFHKKFIEDWVDINIADKKENEWDDQKEREWRKIEFGEEIGQNKLWKIIPPGYPTQNSLLTLNESTAKIIIKQSKKGFFNIFLLK
ncbi:unnamed protein product [Meloidogyne enterolobii]|uniref:Uncharacterized protein n=1 Tax=Meloidogyne enterolobii TaxID=390850 RepID=A0ACB0ZFH5_MELEN